MKTRFLWNKVPARKLGNTNEDDEERTDEAALVFTQACTDQTFVTDQAQ